MPGGDGKEFLLRVPEVTWGTLRITNVLFVSRPDESYSPTSSKRRVQSWELSEEMC